VHFSELFIRRPVLSSVLAAFILLINPPVGLISEGLAEVGVRFIAGRERWLELFTELCARAGLALSTADAQRTGI